MLAFLGEGHRFSDIVLGVGSDPASEFCARADALWTFARQAVKREAVADSASEGAAR